MITSPIDPMRYWKLEEIQRMLNQIEGYENVAIEFKYQQSDSWNKDHYDCTCGIKEKLVNGQWNWLLKYMFVIDAKNESEARLAALQEAAERLVTDIWKNSIHSFRKEQKQINNFQQRTEFKNPPLTEKQTKNLITNIEKTNTNTQTKTTWWTETKLWIVSSIFFITFLSLGWFYPMIALAICGIALGALVLYLLIWLGTILLKDVLGLDNDE
jgi:hypothetical protein